MSNTDVFRSQLRLNLLMKKLIKILPCFYIYYPANLVVMVNFVIKAKEKSEFIYCDKMEGINISKILV